MPTYDLERDGKTHTFESPRALSQDELATISTRMFGMPAAPKMPQKPTPTYPQGTVANLPGALAETVGLPAPEAVAAGSAETRPGVRTARQVLDEPQGVAEHLAQAAVYGGALGAVPGGTALPAIAGRLLLGTMIGAGVAAPGEHVRGAIKGAMATAAGEVLGAPLAIAGQRVTGRAFDRLSDDVAERIVAEAKQLVPWFRHLPQGQEGARALLTDQGTKILTSVRESVATQLGHPENLFERWAAEPALQQSLRWYNEGTGYIKALRAMKVLDPTTRRVDPEALVTGTSKILGVKKPETVWDLFLKAERAPKARKAVGELAEGAVTEGGKVPTRGAIPMPFVRGSARHAGVGEHLPILPYSRNIPTTGTEQAVRDVAPSLTAGAAQMTPLGELAAEIFGPRREFGDVAKEAMRP